MEEERLEWRQAKVAKQQRRKKRERRGGDGCFSRVEQHQSRGRKTHSEKRREGEGVAVPKAPKDFVFLSAREGRGRKESPEREGKTLDGRLLLLLLPPPLPPRISPDSGYGRENGGVKKKKWTPFLAPPLLP